MVSSNKDRQTVHHVTPTVTHLNTPQHSSLPSAHSICSLHRGRVFFLKLFHRCMLFTLFLLCCLFALQRPLFPYLLLPFDFELHILPPTKKPETNRTLLDIGARAFSDRLYVSLSLVPLLSTNYTTPPSHTYPVLPTSPRSRLRPRRLCLASLPALCCYLHSST